MKKEILYLAVSSVLLMLIGLVLGLYFNQILIFQLFGLVVQVICLVYSTINLNRIRNICKSLRK